MDGAADAPLADASTGQAVEHFRPGWRTMGDGTAGSPGQIGTVAWPFTTPPSNGSFEFDVKIEALPSYGHSISVAIGDAMDRFYYFELRYGRVQLFRRDGGDFTWLDNFGPDGAVVAGDRVGIRVIRNDDGSATVVPLLNGNMVSARAKHDPNPLVTSHVFLETRDPEARVSAVHGGPAQTGEVVVPPDDPDPDPEPELPTPAPGIAALLHPVPIGRAATGQEPLVVAAGWTAAGDGTIRTGGEHSDIGWMVDSTGEPEARSCTATVKIDQLPTPGRSFTFLLGNDDLDVYYFECRWGRAQVFRRQGGSFDWLERLGTDGEVKAGDTIGIKVAGNKVTPVLNGQPLTDRTVTDPNPMPVTHVRLQSGDAAVRVSDLRVYLPGTNLVPNGYGKLLDNSGFPGATFVTDGKPAGVAGMFEFPQGYRIFDERIEYDPEKEYRVSAAFRGAANVAKHGRVYFGLAPRDVDGQLISSTYTMFRRGTTTTLAQPLNTGDTEIHLTDASGWQDSDPSYWRRIIWWDYVTGDGTSWPPETYSRHLSHSGTWEKGGLDKASGTITLAEPWNGPDLPAGMSCSQSKAGYAYMYLGGRHLDLTSEWQTLTDVVTGTTPKGGEPTGTVTLQEPTKTFSLVMHTGISGSGGNLTRVARVSVSHLVSESAPAPDPDPDPPAPDPDPPPSGSGSTTLRVKIPAGPAETGQPEIGYTGDWVKVGDAATTNGSTSKSGWALVKGSNQTRYGTTTLKIKALPTYGKSISLMVGPDDTHHYYCECRYGRISLTKRDGGSFLWDDNRSADNVVKDGDVIGIRAKRNADGSVTLAPTLNGTDQPAFARTDPTPLVMSHAMISASDNGLLRIQDLTFTEST